MSEISDDFDKFLEITVQSGIEDAPFPVPVVAEIKPEDIASVMQSINEFGSWISHYLMISLHQEESKIPPTLYAALARIQTLAREVVSELSPCTCSQCRGNM